jgi:uncharacterized protein (TIGR02266 family)
MRMQRRLPFVVEVDVHTEHNFFSGLTGDISEGGLFVATHLAYDIGTRLEINLVLPDRAEPTALLAEVRWIRSYVAEYDVSAGIGLRFLDAREDLLARIRSFLRARDPMIYEP